MRRDSIVDPKILEFLKQNPPTEPMQWPQPAELDESTRAFGFLGTLVALVEQQLGTQSVDVQANELTESQTKAFHELARHFRQAITLEVLDSERLQKQVALELLYHARSVLTEAEIPQDLLRLLCVSNDPLIAAILQDQPELLTDSGAIDQATVERLPVGGDNDPTVQPAEQRTDDADSAPARDQSNKDLFLETSTLADVCLRSVEELIRPRDLPDHVKPFDTESKVIETLDDFSRRSSYLEIRRMLQPEIEASSMQAYEDGFVAEFDYILRCMHGLSTETIDGKKEILKRLSAAKKLLNVDFEILDGEHAGYRCLLTTRNANDWCFYDKQKVPDEMGGRKDQYLFIDLRREFAHLKAHPNSN